MPLFDFRCKTCGHQFEALVRAGGIVACRSCGGGELEKLLSTFAVSSAEHTQAAADALNKKRAATARRDNIAMEREINEHRHEDH